jgi:hypothetical protein
LWLPSCPSITTVLQQATLASAREAHAAALLAKDLEHAAMLELGLSEERRRTEDERTWDYLERESDARAMAKLKVSAIGTPKRAATDPDARRRTTLRLAGCAIFSNWRMTSRSSPSKTRMKRWRCCRW